jgi:hypothetical protein
MCNQHQFESKKQKWTTSQLRAKHCENRGFRADLAGQLCRQSEKRQTHVSISMNAQRPCHDMVLGIKTYSIKQQ